jgi:molecular chaperone HtpG
VFVRELIQNAADASRCQMYMDLHAQGLSTPESPTVVNQSIRERYVIRVALEERSVVNELSGQLERRQAVIVEDSGIGMDRDIIERFFLQVGRSFYTTKDFLRKFNFSPTSHFGLGFLSTFAVSEHITVDTFKPSSPCGDGPLHFVVTGPRNYLLTEKGQRSSAGTRIEVLLRQQMGAKELTDEIHTWCRRVEFPIHINDLGFPSVVMAENASTFIDEKPVVTEPGGKFVIRAFDINRPGLEGELYVFAHVSEAGESWTQYE